MLNCARIISSMRKHRGTTASGIRRGSFRLLPVGFGRLNRAESDFFPPDIGLPNRDADHFAGQKSVQYQAGSAAMQAQVYSSARMRPRLAFEQNLVVNESTSTNGATIVS